MLQSVLSTGLTEQNMTYPPYIYTAQYNAAASYLLSSIAESLPDNQTYIDIVMPFLKKKQLPVKGGIIEIPDDYRNMYGNPGISVREDYTGECSDASNAELEKQFKDSVNKSKCKSRPINIVGQSEWDSRTTSEYNFPTYEYPIGCFFGNEEDGSKVLKICPFDIKSVEFRYLRNEKTYLFGYIMQPDDTYIYDAATSVETEFTSAAFKYLYKALNSLYAAYTRDPSAQQWSMILAKEGIL